MNDCNPCIRSILLPMYPLDTTRPRYPSSKDSELRTLHDVGGKAKIADRRDLAPDKAQQNEIGGRAERVRRIADDHGRSVLDDADGERPVVDQGIVVEI